MWTVRRLPDSTKSCLGKARPDLTQQDRLNRPHREPSHLQRHLGFHTQLRTTPGLSSTDGESPRGSSLDGCNVGRQASSAVRAQRRRCSMKLKIFIGALVLSTGLCTQSFGFELLDTMLGLNGCGCQSRTRARCCAKPCGQPKSCCAKVACRPKRCCAPKPKTCCAKKSSCRSRCGCDLFAGLRGLFSCGCRSKCGCDAKPKSCCAPKKSCCRSRCGRNLLSIFGCCKGGCSKGGCSSCGGKGGDAGADSAVPMPPDPMPTDPSALIGPPREVFQSATLMGS